MRKIACISMICCLFVLPVMAYGDLVATLYHVAKDSTSAYYGTGALIAAYHQSEQGDVITLSGGAYKAPSQISHGIYIRGAGMETDTIGEVLPTILMGDINVISSNVTFEGIIHRDFIYFGKVESPTSITSVSNIEFVKCRLHVLQSSKGSYYVQSSYITYFSSVRNSTITQSIIDNTVGVSGCIHFYNSIISGLNSSGKHLFINSIVSYFSTLEHQFYNSVIILPRTKTPLSNTDYVSHCLGIGSGIFQNLEPEIVGLNWYVSAPEEVFQDYNADFSASQSFALNSSYQFMGTDSTVIGVYGGMAPFTPYNDIPKIKKFNVASKSTPEGKLRVEIEVTTPNNIQ